MLKELLAVGLGGAIGATARYLLGLLALRVFGTGFPWGTLVANITGCLFIGIASGVLGNTESPTTRLFLVVGVLGGFTTFSAFGYETLGLLQKNAFGQAAGNVVIQVIFGLAAVWCGLALSRNL